MKTVRDEVHDETNVLHPYEIPLTIPILECMLKRNELTMYKDSIHFIYFKLSGGSFPHITPKVYNNILNAFNVISSIYDKYKPNDRKSFLNYFFVLKKLLIVLGKVEYAKCIPQMTTHSKQKELERVWELITNAGINFIQNHPPPGQTPGTRLEGSKNPPPGTIIVYKNPSPGTKQGVKSPTPGT